MTGKLLPGMWKVLMLLILPFAASGALAAQLIMFDDEACPWCLRFKEEVLPVYAKTEEGKAAPIRIIDAAEVPKELEHLEPIIYTPTFVLIDDEGHVIGRIEGYPGYDFFWLRLRELLEKLKEHEATKAARKTNRAESG